MHIRGIVVNENAQPVADANVTASRSDNASPISTQTDHEGGFAFDICPDDEDCTQLRAQHGNRTSSTHYHHDGTPGGKSLTLVIGATITVYGHVTDEHGAPIDGARVATWGSPQTTTDTDGAYRLTGLSPGTIHVHAWKNGRQLQHQTLRAHEDTCIDWTLPPASGRAIRFALSSEAPNDIDVRWSLWVHHPIHLHLEGKLPASRELILSGLPTGSPMQGAVWAPNLQADPLNHYRDADPRPGLIEWRTHLAPAAKQTIRGIVLDERGRSIPSIGVMARGIGIVGEPTCITDAHGRFDCEVERRPHDSIIDDVTFSLTDKQRVMDDRDGSAWQNPRCRQHAYRQLAPNTDVELPTAPAAGLRGRATRNGNAIAGALVTLMVLWTTNEGPFTSQLEVTEADDNGGFAFYGLNAAIGDGLFVRVQAPFVDIVSEFVTLRAGATVTLPELHAQPLATVRGRLLDTSGNPMPDASVSLAELESRLVGRGGQGTETRADGQFTVHGVRPGRYRIERHSMIDGDESPPIALADNLRIGAGETIDIGDLRE